MSNFAWVTLSTNDTYSLGALVLAHSLKRVGTKHQLAILVTPGVSESMRSKLQDVYNVVQEVNVLDSQDEANLALLARPELGVTFTKLHCWRLVQFEKCVFLDADTLVLQNCDELFEREELSAAPDVSWPDCFNTGVFVYRPSTETFNKIIEFALKNGSFDGGDQGLLNQYFADWSTKDIQKHLPFVYNVTAYASYCYLPAFKQFRDKIKILHFAGKLKPWLMQFNSQTKTASTPTDYAHAADLIQLWWNIFCDNVHQKLTDNMNDWPEISAHWNTQHHYPHHNHDHHQQQQQQQQHDHSISAHDHLSQMCQIDLDNIKDFHDPWEDYYEKLENQTKQNEQNSPAYEMPNYDHNVQDPIERDTFDQIHQPIQVFNEPEQFTETEKQIEIEIETETESENQSSIMINECENLTNEIITSTSWNSSYRSASNDVDLCNDKIAISENEDYLVIENDKNLNLINNNNNNNIIDNDSDSTRRAESEEDQEIEFEEAGLAGALSQLRLGEQRTPEQEAYEALIRRQCWESGQVDYSGKDSFENIWKKITETLESKPAPEAKSDQTGSS